MEVLVDNRNPIKMSRREILQGLAAGYVVALSGCVENKAIGRSQLMLVSEGQLAQMSNQAWYQIKKKERPSRDKTKIRKVEEVGDRIVTAAGMGNRNWEYRVFASKQANAFVLPGGQVGVYEGIFDRMERDDHLATVLGHEVGHVTAKHASERASQQLAAQGALVAGTIALAASDIDNKRLWAGVLGAGITFGVILPYSRQHELEADKLGVQYMTRADYNPHEAVVFWKNMMAQRRGVPPPEFMSTHPSGRTRINTINQEIKRLGVSPDRKSSPRWA